MFGLASEKEPSASETLHRVNVSGCLASFLLTRLADPSRIYHRDCSQAIQARFLLFLGAQLDYISQHHL